ncbi:hypothetical protein TNCV_1225641 [Trichonephila clavipes]|nr:hypothetical protein TNCV_1225641 [Trichonephila clavipes]
MCRLRLDKHVLLSPLVPVGDHRTREATTDSTKLCTYSQSVDTAQVALFVRYMSSQDPKEELVRLPSLSRQTKEENTPNAAQKCLEDNKIDLKKRRVSRHSPLQEAKRDLFECHNDTQEITCLNFILTVNF